LFFCNKGEEREFLLWKRRGSYILALYLVFLMMFLPFVGLLETSIVKPVENNSMPSVQQDDAILALDELPLRMTTPLAYDSESDVIVFYGGSTKTLGSNYDDTWSYDYNTNTWTNMSPTTHPPATTWHYMAYHSGMDKIVLFGGYESGGSSSTTTYNQTWIYDYNSNVWTNMAPTTAPPGLMLGCMVYDSQSELIVLFGGVVDGGDSIAETWTYDLSSNTWTNVTTSVHPSARIMYAMTYDSESDLAILFGGIGYYPNPVETLYDTWTYDVDTNTWTEKSPAQHPTTIGGLAYDDEYDRATFFGGSLSVEETEYLSETWTYDCNTDTWLNKNPSTAPSGRARPVLVYDSESERTILFGGVLDGGYPTEEVVHDCWSYDMDSDLWNNVDWDWQEQTPIVSPGDRCGSPMVYDIESDRMVIFSGWPNIHTDGVRYNDTWTYDYNTNTWTNMLPSGLPPGRGGHAMVYDEKADVMVMFGGVTGYQTESEKYKADTWTYDLNTNTWTNMSPPSNPSPRIFSIMGYDNESGLIVLFGGFMQDHSAGFDTWVYNLTANIWTNVTSSIHPEARFVSSMMYDYEEERVLLGGGGNWDGYLNDIWEYNTTTNLWTELTPVSSPPDCGLAMAYDLESKLVIANGGPTNLAEDQFIQGTWTFDLTTHVWNSTYSRNNPDVRSRHCLAYDIESDRTILYGGALPSGSVGEAIGDTWAYNYIVNPPILEPGKVKNLKVNPNAAGNALVLTWQAPDPIAGVTIVGYNVYRGTEVGVYELLAEIGDVHTFVDKTAGYRITYHYTVTAVGTMEGDMCDEVFASLPSSSFDDGVFTFIAYGDTRASSGGGVSPLHDDLVSKYLRSDPEMIIHTGDLMTQGGDAANWPGYLQSVSAVGQWDPNLKIYYAVGNHEQYTSGVPDVDWSTYLSHVDFSDVVDESAGETELYYSFNWQNIHFIFLNSIDGWVGEDFTCPTAQWNWLLSDFEHNDKELVVVSMHNPSYSVRADRPDRWAQAASIRATFHDLFVDNGVDIVFAGHDHQYYHTVRDGIDYVVSGGGGAPLYEIDTEAPDWVAGDVGFSDYHYCVCNISRIDNTYSRLSVYVIKMDGTNADTFSFDFYDPIITTTPTTPTTPTTTSQFPLVMTLTILGGAAAVIIVLAIFLTRKGR
jgi:N-acetylneuraminic acid mutarotase/predicted MPP superfamily phosphohydrolase